MKPLFVHGNVKPALLCKQPFYGPLSDGKGIPVLEDKVPNAVGKRDEAVGMVLGLGNVDLHGGMADVGTLKESKERKGSWVLFQSLCRTYI